MELALEQFAVAVGAQNVIAPGDSRLDAYADPFAFDDRFAAPPVGIVLPGTAEETERVVQIADEHGVSLWTVSRGRNLGYGGAAPRAERSVVLDLQRLNRILAVDVERGFAIVEPGVSFFQLFDHLRDNDIPLMLSVPDLGGGSIIGNALERGFGYTAYGQHSELLCGLDVVFPGGVRARTGMSAFPGDTAHIYKGGYGPSIDGLLFQSGMGVVVSAGVWLRPRPAEIAAVLITAEDRSGLGGLVDALRPLMLDRAIDGVVIVGNALAVASGILPRAGVWDGQGPMPDEAITAVAHRLGIGFWNAKFGLYGDPLIIDAQLAVIERAVAAVPGLAVQVRRYRGDVDASDVHPGDRAQVGIPSGDLIQMAAWRGGTPAHTDFSVVASTLGNEAQRLVDLTRGIIEDAGLDHVGGFTMFGRHAIMLNLVSFDASDPAERDMVKALFSRLITEAAAAGHVPYRAHPAFMDQIADLAGDRDEGLRGVVTTIKSALDPRGTLSPGKQGIWPR